MTITREHDVYAGFGIHLRVSTAVVVALALIDADRRHTGVPPLTADEMADIKSEHARLVAAFCS